jgi:hypothetical protein
MALDLTGLTAYIDEQNFPMVTKSLIGGRTASMLTPQIGVKGKTKINLLDVDVVMQDGSGCAWNANGDVDLTQREIDAKLVKINLEFCPKDLNAYYWRTQMPSGTHQEALPFEEQFANYLVEKVQDEIEKVIWGGNFATGVGNLGMFDGLLIPTASFTDCNAATGSFPTPLTTGLSISNILEAIERIYVETPSAAVAQSDFKIFLGTDKFRTLAAALMNGNGLSSAGGQLNNYTSDFDPLRLIFPGTNIEIVGVGGLEGFNAAYGMSMSNAFLGVDLSSDSEAGGIEAWYSKDDRKYRVAMEFTMGTQFAYPDQVGKVAI